LCSGNAHQIESVLWAIIKQCFEVEVKSSSDYLDQIFNESYHDWDLDKILISWSNHICSKYNFPANIQSITNDFQNANVYLILIDEVLGTGVALIKISDNIRKAEEIVLTSELLGKGPLITLQGVINGIYWQNVILLSNLLLSATLF